MCHKSAGFESAASTRQSVFAKTQNPGQLLLSIASVMSLLNTRSHSKTALSRNTFSRQRIAFLNTSKIERRSWKPLEEELSRNTCRRKNGYVCGGPAEEVYRRVWVPFPTTLTSRLICDTIVSFHQDGFWRHDGQRRSTPVFARTY